MTDAADTSDLIRFLSKEGALELLARLPSGPSRVEMHRALIDRAVAATAGDWEVVTAAWPESLRAAARQALSGPDPLLPAVLPVPADLPPRPTQRLWAVSGRSVWHCDARASSGSWERIDFPGALRTARFFTLDGHAWCFAGGKKAVWACRLDSPKSLIEYVQPLTREPRGGVNAIALSGRRLWATHSELGLTRWTIGAGAAGETVHPELTHIHRTTRGVTALDDSTIWFATGRSAYRMPCEPKRERPAAYLPEFPHSISAVAVAGGICAAACATGRSGECWAWPRGEHEQPVAIRRNCGPVGTVTFVPLAGVPHLLLGTDEHTVTALVPDLQSEIAYDAGPRRIAYAAGAADRIIGMDLDGKVLVLWDVSRPAAPLREIDVRDLFGGPIIDCGVWTGG
ncbi:MAG: hypothetical protein HYY93_00770 [Planctomycetes bacterium]|nr:hypothetical protein [Planctomycetota bacterium]